MRASTTLSLIVLAVASVAAAVVACAGGSDDYYGGAEGGGDDGGGGDGTTGDGASGDGGTQTDGSSRDVFNCSPVGPSNMCATAMDLGMLTQGQSMMVNGNIATAGGQAYVAMSFSGNTLPGYHPQIALTMGATEFAFDVLSDCNGATLFCDDEEAATGMSTWEEFYSDAGDAADFSNVDAFAPIPPSGDDGGVVVRIYRRTGKPLTCNPYVLTVSE